MADDITLISHAQTGDEQAFADLVRKYHAFAYAIVIGIIKDSHDAEEVVQDVFVNAYRGLLQLEDAAKFKSWLAEITRNCARDRMRGQRVDTAAINEVGEHRLKTPDAHLEGLIRAEQRALIRNAVESLPEKDKEIVQGYYLDGASYDELIRTHGLSYSAISVRLSRAKRKLSRRLRHLLTGVFVSPSMTFQQIFKGGLTVMKVGTVSKITVSAAAIIGIAVIGTRHFISSKEDASPPVEIITSTSAPRSDFTRKRVVTAHRPANEPQFTVEEMEQIENFFAQLEETDTQQDVDMAEVAMAGEVFPAATNDDSDDDLEHSNSDFALTPEQQREVDSIIQRIYDGTDEYRGLIEIFYADIPWTPEVHEQRLQAEQRKDELEAEFPNLVAKYYMLTQDMDGLEQLLPLFEGVIEIEFFPPVNEGGPFSMEVNRLHF